MKSYNENRRETKAIDLNVAIYICLNADYTIIIKIGYGARNNDRVFEAGGRKGARHPCRI